MAGPLDEPPLFAGLPRSLGVVAGFVFVTWLGLRMANIHFALVSSLLVSLALTAALQIGTNAARRFGS